MRELWAMRREFSLYRKRVNICFVAMAILLYVALNMLWHTRAENTELSNKLTQLKISILLGERHE